MKEKIILKGRGITSGISEGEALVSKEYFGFTHGVDPYTGNICDKRHEWVGKNLKNKVLIFPFGKSSSSGGLFILELLKAGNSPAGVINLEVEPVIGAGFIIAKILYKIDIPVLDKLVPEPFSIISNGDYVVLNAKEGIVEVYKK